MNEATCSHVLRSDGINVKVTLEEVESGWWIGSEKRSLREIDWVGLAIVQKTSR